MSRNILIHTRNLSIPGGKQTYIKALQPYFKNQVSYFYYGKKGAGKESAYTFLKRMVSDYFQFYRMVKRGDFDLVHINTSLNRKSYLRDSVFVWISRYLGVKTLVYWHGWKWDFEQKFVGKYPRYFHFTFGKADAMVCLAGEFAERLKSYGYNRKVYVETTVVEDPILYHSSQDKGPSDNGNIDVLFLTRIERAKGIYETLDCFKDLPGRYPGVTLKVAGTGSELSRAQTHVLEKQIPNVHFLGWISGEERLKTLSEAHIFVHPSYSEGMPISVLEAMAIGLPVITTNVGGIQDFFKPGEMGLIIRPEDTADLRNAIIRLLEDPELCEQTGNYNKEYARLHFAAEQVCKRLESIYEEAITCDE